MLFFRGAAWETANYGVDFAFSDTATGFYTGNATDEPRLLSTELTGLTGPGHNSVVTDAGGQDYVVYHAWNVGCTKRQMFTEWLDWSDGFPRRAGVV